MLKLGYKLMSEEPGPADLVRNAQRAEQAGFDFAAISDHFSPCSRSKATHRWPGPCWHDRRARQRAVQNLQRPTDADEMVSAAQIKC